MKFLNNLYTIDSKDVVDASIRYNIHLDASHFIYQAHFPDEPITPGVCIIQIAKELLEEHLGIGLEIQKVKNVKFLNVISPLATPNVTYVFEKIIPGDSEKTYKILTQVSSGEISLAKLSFTCIQQ